ncbi:MAG TPA: hypothetical protein VMG12_27060, partial [Polyangiaceae bacterium]|nr:hypothetical protein [Polyangiaceae bacterium]
MLALGEPKRTLTSSLPFFATGGTTVMKAGEGSGQTSSRESWLSAPLSDPNAALWASITPPANPNLATIVRRRAASFSLDLLAQRLYLRFPTAFASRATARVAIL